jgi:hypothetical protein
MTDDGASLVWAGGSLSDYIFAFSGNQVYPEPIYDTRFYCYYVPTDTWDVRYDNLPEGIGD